MKRFLPFALAFFLLFSSCIAVNQTAEPTNTSTETVIPSATVTITPTEMPATATETTTPTEMPAIATATETSVPMVELKLVRDGSHPETYLQVPYEYFTDGTVLKNELAQTEGFDQDKVKYIPFVMAHPFGLGALRMPPFVKLGERSLAMEFFYKTTTPEGENIWVISERYLSGDGSIGFLHFAVGGRYTSQDQRSWYLSKLLSRSSYLRIDYDLTNYRYSKIEYGQWQTKGTFRDLKSGLIHKLVDEFMADPSRLSEKWPLGW